MNRKIKIVWILTLLSSFLLMVIQSYWLYTQFSYSLGAYEKESIAKIIRSESRYEDFRTPKNDESQYIGYVMTACVGPDSIMMTSVSSPHITEKNASFFLQKSIKVVRDTLYLPEMPYDIVLKSLNSHVTQLRKPFVKARFDSILTSCVGRNDYQSVIDSTSSRIWSCVIRHHASLFHPSFVCYIPYDPLFRQGVTIIMPVSYQPLLMQMGWQLTASLLVTILLLLSFVYQIRVILRQKKLDELRNDFVHTMIHELKRPVQTLKMCVSLINNREKQKKTERIEEMSSIISEEVDNLTAYINKLREVIKTEEEMPLSITAFPLRQMLERLIGVFQKTTVKEVHIALRYECRSDTMRGDEMQLSNVFSNLLENSVKYSREIIHITVVCQDTEDGISILFSDDGIGIPANECGRVFQKFYRGHSFPNSMLPGMGLGLSYVQMVVKAHQGKIDLQSTESKGTAITLYIPQTL